MVKNIFAVLSLSFLLVNASSIICMGGSSASVFELIEENVPYGGTNITMYQCHGKLKKKLGFLSVSKASSLKKPLIMLKETAELSELNKLVDTLTTKNYHLEKTLVLGDLYILPEFRGKGYAKILVDNTCREVMKDPIENIVLIPQPFEYENNQQKILSDQPDYEEKVAKLMNLYAKCGFKKINDNEIFMGLNKVEKSDLIENPIKIRKTVSPLEYMMKLTMLMQKPSEKDQVNGLKELLKNGLKSDMVFMKMPAIAGSPTSKLTATSMILGSNKAALLQVLLDHGADVDGVNAEIDIKVNEINKVLKKMNEFKKMVNIYASKSSISKS